MRPPGSHARWIRLVPWCHFATRFSGITRLGALACLASLVCLGTTCGEGDRTRARKAETRRQTTARTPLPLRSASTSDGKVLLERLDHTLTAGTPPFLVERRVLTGAQALADLAEDRLDLLLLTGDPDPSMASLLARARKRAHVLALGADVIAVLANVTNRSSRIDLEGLGQALGGQASSWERLRGDTLPLVPYTLPAQSDLTRLLRDQLLNGKPLGVAVRQVADVETQIESTRRTPGALAVVALHHIGAGQPLPEAVKLLPLSGKPSVLGILPTDRAAASRGDYPLRLPVVALVRRGDDPVARRLRARFLQASAAARQAWLALPALPASERERIRRAWAGDGPAGAIPN